MQNCDAGETPPASLRSATSLSGEALVSLSVQKPPLKGEVAPQATEGLFWRRGGSYAAFCAWFTPDVRFSCGVLRSLTPAV